MRFILILLLAWASSGATAQVSVQSYEIVRAYPHDSAAFTQGLFFHDGALFESTGMVGESTLRKVRLRDGKVLRSAALPPTQFGEGSTGWGNEIVSVTWRDGMGHRWDSRTLRRTGSFTYPGEGWGLTQDGTSLILSDGTAWLRFLDPVTFQERRRIQVTAEGLPVADLNELEWVKGEILANVWMTDRIARIDPATGNVTGWIDLAGLGLTAGATAYENVLNGIAYDTRRDRLFVTGKRWSKLFEIRLKPTQR